MVQNKTLIFKKAPAGFPVAGEHLAVEDRGFDLEAAPPSGGLTLSVLWASYDPYLRGKMREGGKSYTPPFDMNGPFINDCVARVLKSDTPDYQPGDLVVAYLPFSEYAALKKDELSNIRRKVPKDNFIVQKGLDLGLLLGPLGMPGLTAWSSLYEIGQPKKGETIFISSAAGAVGQVVGQVSKREGLRVIGSVGTDAKLDFITKDLGFDGGFNYKKESPADALKRLCPDGIDIYYENVGGEHLEAAIDNMNTFGRIVACGMVSPPPLMHPGPQDRGEEDKGGNKVLTSADLTIQR
jgi:NADPH-dependent curcumin reductase CurA